MPRFDPAQARRNSQEAQDEVERNADRAWLDRAFAVVERLANTKPELHSDDIWEVLGDDVPREARALGPVMGRASRAGLIRRTERIHYSTLANCNGHPRPIWESLVFVGATEKVATASDGRVITRTPRPVLDPLPYTRAKPKSRTGSASSTGSRASEPHVPGSRYAAYLARKQRAANSTEGS